MVLDVKADTGLKIDSITSIVSEKVEKLWQTINKVKDDYMETGTHELLCENQKLVMEQVFSKCLKTFEDNMFKKMREQKEDLTKQMSEVLKQVKINGK